jgi:hypothetical protein
MSARGASCNAWGEYCPAPDPKSEALQNVPAAPVSSSFLGPTKNARRTDENQLGKNTGDLCSLLGGLFFVI